MTLFTGRITKKAKNVKMHRVNSNTLVWLSAVLAHGKPQDTQSDTICYICPVMASLPASIPLTWLGRPARHQPLLCRV